MKISHPSSRETVYGLAIIDDQASVSFVDPSLRQALRLPSNVLRPSVQSTVTIEGPSKEKPCHILEDLILQPIDGQKPITLPPAIMQNKIPEAWNQVPSREEVANTKGYEQFAEHFLDKKCWGKVPTLVLIGRDCMPAQLQKQFYSEDNPSQIIAQTPLGWVLMGSKQRKKSSSSEAPKKRKTNAFYSEKRRQKRKRVRKRFKDRSNTEQWLLIDRQAMCRLCLSGPHELRNCYQLKTTTRKCRECNDVHSQDIGCRPPYSTLQRNEDSRSKEQENTKATPGNVPSRESDSAPRTSTGRDKRLEVIPEEVLPRAREDKRAPDSPRKVDREVEETSRESDKARQAPNTQRTPWKGPFVCVFCLEKGESQADHYTSECHRWNEDELPNARKWDSLIKNRACLNCLDLGHEISKCPENIRSCSTCLITHGQILRCRSEVEAVEKDVTPDKSSRESKRPEAHASNSQTPTVPQPQGAIKKGNEPEQHVPNAQAVGVKEGGSLYPKINTQEEVRKLECSVGGFFNLKLEKTKRSKVELGEEATKDKTLTLAPSWLKQKNQAWTKDSQKEMPDSPHMPLGDQDIENYAPSAPSGCDLCGSSCSSSIECWRNRVDGVREKKEIPTHPPKILEEGEAPEKENSAFDEKKHCESCFLSGLPTDHDESDEEYHDLNLEYLDPCHEGVSCDRCGEQDISDFRHYCPTCQDYNLCNDCEDFSYENEATFISKKGKRHEPNHVLEGFEAPRDTDAMVLKTDYVAKTKLCPRCLQKTCTSTGGLAPCEDKDMERPSSPL